MPTFLQSWSSSVMAKKLIRYALSKLELLDTDALDVDNLDLAIGRNTVFEFRDVGLRLKKLESVLKLPRTFAISRAKVLALKVTIPVDIYASPILVEVNNVVVKVRVAAGGRPTTSGQRPKSSDETIVPNAVDLAQSFLETEHTADRARLERALAGEQESEDEEPSLRTGQPLSLPAFIAGFLQGVIDRIQVQINRVTFNLDVEVDLGTGAVGPELVSFQATIDGIDVQGVTTSASGNDSNRDWAPKEGKRYIALNNLRAFLISEQQTFIAFGRSPSVSPEASQAPRTDESGRIDDCSEGLTQSQLDASHYEDFPMHDSELALEIPYEFSQNADDEADETASTPRASQMHDYPFPNLAESDTFDNHYLVQISDNVRNPDIPAFMEAWPSQSTSLDEADQKRYSDTVRSGPGFVEEADQGSQLLSYSPPSDTLEDGRTSPGPVEDLTQSRVYTHEEAESMYMSAFSEVALPDRASQGPPSIEHPVTDHPITNPSRQEHSSVEHILPESPPTTTKRSSPEVSFTETSSSEHTPIDTHPPPGSYPSEQSLHMAMPGAFGWGSSGLASSYIAGTHSSSLQGENSLSDGEAQGRTAVKAEPDEPPEVVTPRGPSRLVKEILSLRRVSIYVPSSHESVATNTDVESVSSRNNQLPGSFSLHFEPQTRTDPVEQKPTPFDAENEMKRALEVILSPIEVKFDAGLGFLLISVVSKLLEAMKTPSRPFGPSRSSHVPQTPQPAGTTAPISIVAESIAFLFLHRVGGVADTGRRILEPTGFQFDEQILLKAVISNFTIFQERLASKTTTRIGIERFIVGYVDSDILSFRPARLSETITGPDLEATGGGDITAKIMQPADGPITIDFNTSELHVLLELQRIDDTLSWFGGLSSFLNMSTSAISTTAPPTPMGTRELASPPPFRSVRFSDAAEETPPQLKINGRLGGASLDIVGRECSLGLATSSVNVVIRKDGAALRISKWQFSGPYLTSSSAPPVEVNVRNTKITFQNAPKAPDLDRLLRIVVPSAKRFDGDEELMVDMLIRQRKKGALLILEFDQVDVHVKDVHSLSCLPGLGEELARLSTVAKYLPEDDRPGLLTLTGVKRLDFGIDFGNVPSSNSMRRLGRFGINLGNIEVAHITMPALIATAFDEIMASRNSDELITTARNKDTQYDGPVLMMRMIGDEMEPVVKLRMQDLSFEYRVPVLMDLMGLNEDATREEFEAGLVASVANIGEQVHAAFGPLDPAASVAKQEAPASKPLTLDVRLRDCLIGLNPLDRPSKLVICLADSQTKVTLPDDIDMSASLEIKRAFLVLTDDVAKDMPQEQSRTRLKAAKALGRHVGEHSLRGFVNICDITSAKILIRVSGGQDRQHHVEVEVADVFTVLETCADSTQTLIGIAAALTPPSPPNKAERYRTQIMPIRNVLESITEDAFGTAEGDYDFDKDFALARQLAKDDDDPGSEANSSTLDFDSQYYADKDTTTVDKLFEAESGSVLIESMGSGNNDAIIITGFNSGQGSETSDSELVLDNSYFESGSQNARPRIWNSARAKYDNAPSNLVKRSPLRLTVRNVDFVWDLHDGYDWIRTRDLMATAINRAEARARERRERREPRLEEDAEFDEVVGDTMFNSVYIHIPANRDPGDVAADINWALDDQRTETGSIATTVMTGMPSRRNTVSGHSYGGKKLKLGRSRYHKIKFDLTGLRADVIVLPPDSGETQVSANIGIETLEIFDNMPTSTWKKFLTYDFDHGEREMGRCLANFEVLVVQPHADLAASELVVRTAVLPLRLHVDQDALDFITRFFAFKDDQAGPDDGAGDSPFLQRVEVQAIPVKLDFKPKRVDYAGLRSGKTTEFMNFLILDESRMVLRHAIVYGQPGFARLGECLNSIWTPDVRGNQLPGVLAGVSAVRPLVDVGSGFKQLVGIRENAKDGRVVRSIGKGAYKFARHTGKELVKMGAKLAVGTQYALEGVEEMLAPSGTVPSSSRRRVHEERVHDDSDSAGEEARRAPTSLYSAQPANVLQGLRVGYSGLRHDLSVARDAAIALPAEMMESGSAHGAAKAVLKRTQTLIFRPSIGMAKAAGQVLLGATNSIDPDNRRRADDKYKSY